MATRVTSTRFVGRTGELAELRAALGDAAAGRPSLAFVAGESGVGKTRLVNELERSARRAPHHDRVPDGPGADAPGPYARVIGGDCVQLGSGELPYAPLVAALRPLARAGDPVLDRLDPGLRAELGRFLPGHGVAGPSAAGPSAATDGSAPLTEPAAPSASAVPPPPAAVSSETDGVAQGRLFEALLHLFDTLAQDQPLLLVIEDLHWADRSTRAFLSFLSRSLCHERILVVATYRPDELHRRHPLRPLLAELERDAHARRIELAPLSREELAEQLADILGAPPDHGLVDRLYARSEGNPLFSEELLAAGLDGRGGLPPTLRDALMLRIEQLSDDAQEVLRTLALGQRLHHAILAEAAGLDGRALREALRDAVSSQILVADDEGRYAFRHALLREVVDDDLLPGERAELHLALAHALERRVDEVGEGVFLTSGIAHHYASAGDQPAALRAAIRAADAAERVHAYGEEAELLERALALWPNVADAETVAGRPHARVLRSAATAHQGVGEHARAETLLVAALEQIDRAADPRQAAVTLERLARVRWAMLRPIEALELAQEGLDLLEGDVSVERARLLAWWAKARMLQGRYREAVEVAREALALAQAVGDEAAESRARNALGVSLAAVGDPDAGARELRRAIEVARLSRSIGELTSAYTNLADAMHIAGRTRTAREIAEEGHDLAPTGGADRLWLAAALSEFSYALGDWDAAARILPEEAERRAAGAGRLNVLLRRLDLALGVGDDERAGALLPEIERLADGSSEPQCHVPVAEGRARYEQRRGDLDAARAAIDRGLDRIEFCAEDAARMALLCAVGVEIEAETAQRARDRREDDAEPIRRAEAMFERVRAAAEDAGPVERANLLHAQAELARAHGDHDPAAWIAAEQAWLALDYPYPAVRARWKAAEGQVQAGDRVGATASVRDALVVAERLGAAWLVDELRSLAARGRLRLDDDPTAAVAVVPADGTTGNGTATAAALPADGTDDPAAAGTAPADPFGLTPRERQVLTLVAGGATNREIGQQLFMAEKTASVHVSRILAKLDVRSRTEAAAVAHRLGLAAV
ncbi:helix-turn-helix transcriptional regulator [Patulibacter defluvii]|uniref:helix-turn-helix transcriptional regulator n=1 Tax=Patulibacter defluvii TaxID=3095358 RepID=UPI002A760BD9|nr:AAA family ATPase [Patulibacter sp. DM4]